MSSATHHEHRMHSGELADFMATEMIREYENVQIEHLSKIREVIVENNEGALYNLIKHNWGYLTGLACTRLKKQMPHANNPTRRSKFKVNVEIKVAGLIIKHFSDNS